MTTPSPPSDEVTLSLSAIQAARHAGRESGRSLIAELAIGSDFEPRQLVRALGRLFAMPAIETSDMLRHQAAFDILPLSTALARNAVVLRSESRQLMAIMGDPFDLDLQTLIETKSCQSITYQLALEADIQAFLAKQEHGARAVDQIEVAQVSRSEDKDTVLLSFSSATTAPSPAVRLVNSTLYDALKSGASDVHLESTASGLAVKYRIDGVLDNVTIVQGIEAAEHVISRLKVLSELDISERRIPQDGSFRVRIDERDIDLRVSIMPSIHGEDAVIRILDKRSMVQAHGALTLEALGFDATSLSTLRQLADEPYGMLMVTGPTGSGKTTTLYAVLTETNSGREKIITIEDPVEYQLPGILQIPVNEKKGLTFGKGLRSILRHDPDKIMVGEIRDRDTAEIAVQSALTGHLVLTTVHANNVFDVFGRFTHLGTDLYAFVSALNGIWAQRLVRMNCAHCATPYQPNDAELARISLSRGDVTGFEFMHGTGCGDCRGTGYKGRKAIAEILVLNDEIRERIVAKQPIRQIKELARRNGTRSLREAALELVRNGQTTLEEVKRVTLHA